MQPLSVLLISDQRPGHFRLSEGISAAIQRRRPVTITRLDVHRPRWLPGRLQSSLINAGANATVQRLLNLPTRPAATCDLVVSAGADTLAANILLAHTYGSPNIFYGSLRRYDPKSFALVLTSYAANADKPNHAQALKPSAFDPATLPTPEPSGPTQTIALLIGGDSGTIRYGAPDWNALLALLAEKQPGVRWLVSNSRRTPDSVSDVLAAVATTSPERISLLDVRSPGAPGLTDTLAQAHIAAVTIDSSSMISEAVWARRPVVVLAPGQWTLPPLEQSYRDWMSAQAWCTRPVPLQTTNTAEILALARRLSPMTENPLDNLANLIAARIPELFAK